MVFHDRSRLIGLSKLRWRYKHGKLGIYVPTGNNVNKLRRTQTSVWIELCPMNSRIRNYAVAFIQSRDSRMGDSTFPIRGVWCATYILTSIALEKKQPHWGRFPSYRIENSIASFNKCHYLTQAHAVESIWSWLDLRPKIDWKIRQSR